MTIGEKLKEKRERMGLSQREVAEKTKLTNISVCNVEKGLSCNLQTILRICEVLELRIELVDAIDNSATNELSYDIKKCCKQLDRVKKTLINLIN